MDTKAYKRPFFTFLCYMCAGVILCGILAAYFGIRYDGVDDAFISDIAAGAFGTSEGYFLLIGYPLSIFINFLRLLLPSGVNWYTIFTLFIICVSCGAIGLCLHRRFGFLRGGTIWAVFALMCAAPAMMAINRVKTGAIVTVAGLLLLSAWYVGLKKSLPFAALLCAFGCMYSFKAWAVAVIIFVPVFISFIMHGAKRARVVIAFAVCLALCGACLALDAFEYSGSRAQYREYSQLASDLSKKDIALSDISALGFNDTDLELITLGDFNDEDYFTTAKLTAVSDRAQSRSVSGALAQFREALSGFGVIETAFFALACALLAIFFSIRRNKPYLIIQLIISVLCAGALCFMGVFTSALFTSVLLSCAMFALLLTRGTFLDDDAAVIAAAILFVMCVPMIFAMRAENRDYLGAHTIAADSESWAEVFADNTELYVIAVDCAADALGGDVFHARQSGAFTNTVFLGGAPARTPLESDVLNDFDEATPWQAVFNGAPLLIKGDAQPYIDYVREQCGKTLTQVGIAPVPMYRAL